MTRITQAFIFAAGRGERMRPLTDTIPKPLVKIKGKAIIDYIIEKLDKISSIEKIIINGFYLANQLEEHIKKLNNSKIIFSKEIEKVETGGGLVFAKNKINLNEPLLLINGDVLWLEEEFSDINRISNAWNESESNIILGLKKSSDYIGYEKNTQGGDFNLINNQLFRFSDSPMSYAFVGLQIINPAILERAPEKCFSMSYFYKSKIKENGLVQDIKGVELQGRYFHIGNMSAIKMAEERI